MSLSDVEYQNQPIVLKVAPWLDLPALRVEMKKALLRGLAPGGVMSGHVDIFKEDVTEFCEGKRNRIPRETYCIHILNEVISRLFPVSQRDRRLGEALDYIHMHLLQRDHWGHHNRGGTSEPQPATEDDYEDNYEEDYSEEDPEF